MKKTLKNVIKTIVALTLLLLAAGASRPTEVLAKEAEEVEIGLEHSAGKSCKILRDGSTKSSVTFTAGQSLKITADDPIQGLYIKWSAVKIPGEWTLKVGGQDYTYGKYNYLHEYVSLPFGTTECALYFPNEVAGMVEIYAYGEGDIPKDVQRWNPPCDKADFLVFSTHADDEVLFLGGVCVTYGGQMGLKTQVVYLCDFTLDDYGYKNTTREHEKLDGLWEMGITNYPINGTFPDAYSNTLEKAKKQYDYGEIVKFAVEMIRRFKPLVLVSQDFKGEYGHGAHMLFAAAAADAIEDANDPNVYVESYEKYGTWDVPKAYYHLYVNNKIRLDLRQPLSQFDGKTSLDVQKSAYKKHVTQQRWSFYVTDEKKEYDCAAFGLYRSLVGPDTMGDNMIENITSYEEQWKNDMIKTVKIGKNVFFKYGLKKLVDYLVKAEL